MMNDTDKQRSFAIGNCQIGQKNHILLQSMTSTSTKEIEATIDQCIRIAKAGADMIRITARDIKEAENLAIIKLGLKDRGWDLPIIADVHFNPKVAEKAAALIDKVRINPGNYMDKKSGKLTWSEEEYKNELERIKERLKTLTDICNAHETTLRVGVNHGSLSERIINRYGDTARGMAESAMEFIRIFKELNFSRLVISLKASNVLVMIEANEIFKKKMEAEGFSYPMHLGVTEAGDAEDGRIKSAIGIGSLLAEGIGDTIRVSLTEDPEFEIPVAQEIVKSAKKHPNTYQAKNNLKNQTLSVANIGGENPPIVLSNFANDKADYLVEANKWNNNTHTILACELKELVEQKLPEDQNYFLKIRAKQINSDLLKTLSSYINIILLLEKTEEDSIESLHLAIDDIKSQVELPIVLQVNGAKETEEAWMVEASIITSSFLLSSKLNGLFLNHNELDSTQIAFGILQASRQRISKTEYIACPSCGRTLFNIQEKLQEVKSKTAQFKGLKIAVMGCIVNGLGEMADADYGYVGAGKGKVNIYKGKELMLKNIDEEAAADALLEILNKTHK